MALAVYELTDARPAGHTVDGITFREQIGPETLVDAVIGEVGDTRASPWTSPMPEDGIRIAELCQNVPRGYWANVEVEQQGALSSGGCSGDPVVDAGVGNDSTSPGYDFEPGSRVQIRIWVSRNTEGPVVEMPDVRLGLAVYELAPPAVQLAGWDLPQRYEYDGHLWELEPRTASPREVSRPQRPTMRGLLWSPLASTARLAIGSAWPASSRASIRRRVAASTRCRFGRDRTCGWWWAATGAVRGRHRLLPTRGLNRRNPRAAGPARLVGLETCQIPGSRGNRITGDRGPRTARDRARAGGRRPGARPAPAVGQRCPGAGPGRARPGRLEHEGGLVERDAMVFQAARRIAQLDAAHEGLVFGRLDLRASSNRAALHRPDRAARRAARSLLIDWRAPAAAVFYQATAAEPHGVVRRRVLRCAGRQGRRRRGRAARRRSPRGAAPTCRSSARAR